MEQYEEIEIEVIQLDEADIITTSTQDIFTPPISY